MGQTVTKILIVDDEMLFRWSLRSMLSKKGYKVVEATCGKEALDYLSEDQFDYALVDVNMPGINGFQVVESGTALNPKCKFVIMTANVTEHSKAAATLLGVPFVEKSTELHKVWSEI